MTTPLFFFCLLSFLIFQTLWCMGKKNRRNCYISSLEKASCSFCPGRTGSPGLWEKSQSMEVVFTYDSISLEFYFVLISSRLHQMAKLYLFGPSSGLYTCPLAMTDGAARLIEVHMYVRDLFVSIPWCLGSAGAAIITRCTCKYSVVCHLILRVAKL